MSAGRIHLRRNSARRAAGGFTLVEVLATFVLVSIVLPVAMKGLSIALATSDDARRRLEAATLAENKLAELTVGTTATGGAAAGDFSPDWPDYAWEAASVARDVDLMEVQVRVTWQSRGTPRSVMLSTMTYIGTSTGPATGSGGPSATSGGGSGRGGAP